jgi:7-cyano-7-deazaguanine synthase
MRCTDGRGCTRAGSAAGFAGPAIPSHALCEDSHVENAPKAVVLLSGGMDSATTLAVARRQGFQTYALSFDYGQRHRFELEAARRVALAQGTAHHLVLHIDLPAFGGSALTDDIEVPRNRVLEVPDIPVTYVPARNTIFLSFALGWAEVLGSTDIFIGVNAIDYSGYPDCRPEFIQAFERLARLATRAGVEGKRRLRIHTPLIHLTKAQIVRLGTELGVDFSLTHTCYDPDPQGRACGTCDACRLRLRGFAECGLQDPLPYQREAGSGDQEPGGGKPRV